MARDWSHTIISGGASGLGHGIAERLLKRGTKVSVLDLTVQQERAAALDAAAQRNGTCWQFFRTDVTDEGTVTKAVANAVTAYGPPDLAMNSAGIGLSQAFADMPSAAYRQVIEINLIGSYHFAAAVLPHLRRGGRLALVASLAGITSNYGYAAYGSSKFGVVGLATALRFEYEPLGIHISCICPPEVKTPMVEKEYATGNPIALELKQIAGSIEIDEACDGILAGLDAGKWLIIPGTKGKLTAFAARRMPGLFYAFTASLIRKIMRKHGLPAVG